MTVQKVVSIKNTGRFQNCSASGDTTLRKQSLLFAENGRGKTTLCAILRSLQSGNGDFVMGRKTLGQEAPPEIDLLLADGLAAFRDGGWDKTLPSLAVFDGTYVSENVHAGDAVDTEQRRNLYKVIIGSAGVALARRVEELDGVIREKATAVTRARSEIERHVPQGMTLEAFIALEADPSIDAAIEAAQTEFDAVRKADRLQARAGLTRLELPALPSELHETLAKSIDGIAADAEAIVANHIHSHRMEGKGEPWINEGRSYIADDECPFCGQDLKGVALIDAYKSFFSDAYHQLKQSIEARIREVEQPFGERAVSVIDRSVDKNVNDVAFWKEYCTFEAPALASTLEEVRTTIDALRDAVISLLRQKQAAPLEKVTPGEAYIMAVEGYKALLGDVRGYNEKVDAVNAVIEVRKREAGAADLAAVERSLAHLRAQKIRHTEEVIAACARFETLTQEKNDLDTQKADVKKELDAHTEAVITTYGKGINRYLDRFNAGFSISTPTHDYRGRTPSTSYQILINETPVPLGAPSTPLSEPSFKNTLSAGDRSTLALAFFFAQLETDPERAAKIVVLDDPFTSQDMFRRTQTAMEIRRCAEQSAQLLLLSHDPFFLKLVWDMLAPADRKALQLARVGEKNTTVAEWDIDEAVKARYRADVECLQRYYSDGVGAGRDIVQKLRPVLEGFCCNLYPSQFKDDDTLGAIIGKVRGEGDAHPLSAIADDLDDLNEYTKRYHHGENPNAATEAINDAELAGFVKRTLKTVGNLI